MASLIDITDLIRGEGEWKNMQEIVRRTFKICFDQIQKQNEHITKLVGNVASLKVKLSARPDYDEFEKLIESKQTRSYKGVSRDELERITNAIVNIKADLERKAGISYVDDSLRRKVDKSDVLLHNLSKMTSTQYSGDIAIIHNELEDIKLKLNSNSNIIIEATKEQMTVQSTELSVLKGQLSLLTSAVDQTYSRADIHKMIDQKVIPQLHLLHCIFDDLVQLNSAELDVQLCHKVDSATLAATASRIEDTLAQHEKLITSLRVRLNDDALFSSDHMIADKHNTQLFGSNSAQPRAAAAVSFSSGGAVRSGVAAAAGPHHQEFVREEGDMDSLLKLGRVEAIVQGLWQKMNNVLVDASKTSTEVAAFRAQLQAIDSTVRGCAGARNVETLAAVVEEQRLRLDSLILGSTSIEPIAREFHRIDDELAEVRTFLQLPQRRPLSEQLAEAGQLIDTLSKRVGEVGTAVGRAALRIETLEVNNHQLETRVQLAENFKEKVDRLNRICEFSDTDYSSCRDLSASVSHLWREVRAGPASTASRSQSQLSLNERVEAVESEVQQSVARASGTDAKITELKQIVYSLSVNSMGRGLSHGPGSAAKQQHRSVRPQNVIADRHQIRVPDPFDALLSSAAQAHSTHHDIHIADQTNQYGRPSAHSAQEPIPAPQHQSRSQTDNTSDFVSGEIIGQPRKESVPVALVQRSSGNAAEHYGSDVSAESKESKESKESSENQTRSQTFSAAGATHHVHFDHISVHPTATTMIATTLGERKEQIFEEHQQQSHPRTDFSAHRISQMASDSHETPPQPPHTCQDTQQQQHYYQRESSQSSYHQNAHPTINQQRDALPTPLSLLSTGKLVQLTSVERIDERLEQLKREKEVLKQRLLSRIEI